MRLRRNICKYISINLKTSKDMWLILVKESAKFSNTVCVWRNSEEEARAYRPYYNDEKVVQIIFVKEGKQY